MNTFLKKLLRKAKSANIIYIMTHRYMDLDGFGASLGLCKLLQDYNKNVFIITNDQEQDSSIQKAREKMGNSNSFRFVTAPAVCATEEENILLLILDVHKKEMVECPELIDKATTVAIIDHHIQGSYMIEEVPLSYICENVSSTVEIIIDFLKKQKKTIDSSVATIMLAGMYIDTNNFNVKTTSNTYLAGAYLMENGANNVVKQELFQENKKTIIRRQKLLKNSHMINEKMILCTLDKKIYAGSDLAKIAEELLQFEDVEASFAIGYVEENTIGISARSLGKMNVEKVMKKFKGGGHKTDAAARVHGTSLTKVKEKITEILK